MWSTFNNLRNSSTRCEIGAAIAAMMRPIATNIGIDSMATIIKGNAIIKHETEKAR